MVKKKTNWYAIPQWITMALTELGVCEISGANHNKRILEYHATTKLKATSDEISWCSSFVNWCFVKCGYEGTNSAAARSWLEYGTALENPKFGCIVVLKRGSNPKQGHVGFYIGTQGNVVYILGGNQKDSVSISAFKKSDVLEYRMVS